MNRAIKYRIYPTTEQSILFAKTFGCCRFVYNNLLAIQMDNYKQGKEFINKYALRNIMTNTLKKDYSFLREVDSLALMNSSFALSDAYSRFFDKQTGLPKFKSAKHNRKSYTTNNQKGTIAIIENKYIKLPKINKVKAKIHRMPKDDWIIKQATVSQDSDGKYYCSILFEYETNITPVSKPTKIIGLDYKSDGLYKDSNNNIGTNHKYYRKSHNKLAKAQRKLKHKTIGSNNYKKQQQKIAKIHKHIANQRLDNLHKLSTEIANQYDIVCVESLDMKALSNKGFQNGKATMDNGYGMFLTMLEYKLLERGKHFIKVEKWYPSSQLCSKCGKQHKLPLADRVYKCECGLTIDRDLNAAINIKKEGLRLLNIA